MRSRPFSPSLPRQEAEETTEPSDEEGSLQRQEIQPHMEVPVATLNLEAVIIKTSRERIGMLGFHTQTIVGLKRRRKLTTHAQNDYSMNNYPPENKTPKDGEFSSKPQSLCDSQLKKQKKCPEWR